MLLTVISSLDVFCRQQACERVAAAHPGAAVVLHDLHEDGTVLRRLFRDGLLAEREETPLEHGCLSCALRLEVVPTVRRLVDEDHSHVILGLPPGAAAAAVLDDLTGSCAGLFVNSTVMACDPGAIEDQIWDGHTLFESGYTPAHRDERTPGEFLIGELLYSDTVLLVTPELVAVDDAVRDRGVRLARELAPHAQIAEITDSFRLGRHDRTESSARSSPGSVQIPAASAAPFNTVLIKSRRPLHPERFRHALPRLAEANCWLRGRLWVASAPQCRISIRGVGPRVWLESTGTWAADRELHPASHHLGSADAMLDWDAAVGDRGTVLAITGDGVSESEAAELLAGCELTSSEMQAGAASLHDPFELSTSL